MEDIDMGKEFVNSIEDTIKEGLIWKQLSEEGKEQKSETAEKPEENRLKKRQKWKKEEEGEERGLQLTQQVYSEGMRNWTTRASLKQFFRNGGNCNGMPGTNSISADLESGTCEEDSSFQKHLEELLQEKTPDEGTPKPTATFLKHAFLQSNRTNVQPVRSYHTVLRPKKEWKTEERRRFYFDNPQKMLVPIGKQQNTLDLMKSKRRTRKFPGSRSMDENQYRNLKATAKQKFRSFNVQKKFAPSASVLLLLEQQKRKQLVTSLAAKRNKDKKPEKNRTEEENKDTETITVEPNETEKQLVIQKEKDKYKDYILKQLQELKKENDELRKRLSKLDEDKRLESALQTESDNLELERTRLKACWLIMSSTMDAVSNFCKKFSFKSEELKEAKDAEQEEEQEEEVFDDAMDSFDDAQEGTKVEKEKNNLKYDEKYFKFLQKLMEDQMESQLDDKKRTRAGK